LKARETEGRELQSLAVLAERYLRDTVQDGVVDLVGLHFGGGVHSRRRSGAGGTKRHHGQSKSSQDMT
jgi:hypothetical protein